MNSDFTKVIRITLGVALIVFGTNMFLHFFQTEHYNDDLNSMGYVFPTVGILEVIIAVLLLMKKWVAFGLIILAPISITILVFHLFSGLPGMSIALLILMFNSIMIYKHWPQYKPLFY